MIDAYNVNSYGTSAEEYLTSVKPAPSITFDALKEPVITGLEF